MKTLLLIAAGPKILLALIVVLSPLRAAERTGFPSSAERSAMPPRQQVLQAGHASATVIVASVATPGRGGAPHEFAARVAEALGATHLFKSVSAPAELAVLRLPRGGINEARMLWDFARALQAYVKANRPDGDYVLAVDYAFNPSKWEQGYVHFVLCDRDGEWVLVDLQNSHQRDYKAIKPTSAPDCERLLLKRVESRLAEGAGSTRK